MGYLQRAYTAVLSASGGLPPYKWSLSSGQLPPGLVLNAATGAISGTPSLGGQFTATLTATDASGYTASKTFTPEIFDQALDQYGG